METQANPYVFISYAHINSSLVMPAIRELQAQGVTLWYDSGIEAGSEWPEFVAEKVLHCSKFILFISKAYLESQNCKRELNFAISRKKEILSIFLEDVELSPGMEMQLGTYQAIFRKRFANNNAFYASVAKESFFNSCREVVQHANSEPSVHSARQPEVRSQPEVPFQSQPSAAGTEQLPLKSKSVAVLLAFFLGSLGIHKFYLGKKVSGILYLLFCWTYIPSLLAFIDAIVLLVQSKDTFAKKYHCIPK